MSERQDDYRNLGQPVQVENVGKRLDFYLSEAFPFYSRAEWQKRIATHLMTVNELPSKNSYRLKFGDRLAHFHPLSAEPEVDTNVRILWREGGVLCAFKPAGLAMHEHGLFRRKTFRELLKANVGEEWAAVHRLDLDTSGIVLCGASESIRANLCAQIENRQVGKSYLAIAYGVPTQDDWFVDQPIGHLKSTETRIKEVSSDGLAAKTRFKVQQRASGFALLNAFPLTGRTNQIRVHAAHCGFPIVGDRIYGQKAIGTLNHTRTLLHSYEIEFEHPETRTRNRVCSPMADDMLSVWTSLII